MQHHTDHARFTHTVVADGAIAADVDAGGVLSVERILNQQVKLDLAARANHSKACIGYRIRLLHTIARQVVIEILLSAISIAAPYMADVTRSNGVLIVDPEGADKFRRGHHLFTGVVANR